MEDEPIVAADLEMKLTQLGYQMVGSACPLESTHFFPSLLDHSQSVIQLGPLPTRAFLPPLAARNNPVQPEPEPGIDAASEFETWNWKTNPRIEFIRLTRRTIFLQHCERNKALRT